MEFVHIRLVNASLPLPPGCHFLIEDVLHVILVGMLVVGEELGVIDGATMHFITLSQASCHNSEFVVVDE